MDNREILFIIRMRNEARQALAQMGIDLRNLKTQAQQMAAQMLEGATAIEMVGREASAATPKMAGFGKAIASAGSSMKSHTPGAKGFFMELAGGVKHMLGFASAAAVLGGAVEGIRKYGELSTDYANLNGKLKLVTKSTAELIAVRQKLFQISNQSYGNVDDVSESYYKGKMALGKFGFSDNNILALTKAIAEANTISHASPQAAKFGSYELMQGIGAGTLNGRELRFVQNDSIRLAQALADGLNQTQPQLAAKFGKVVLEGTKKGLREITVGDLRDMATKHLLTGTAVAGALMSQVPALDAQMAQLPTTLPRAQTIMHNQAEAAVGAFDEKNGISQGVVEGMKSLAMILPQIGEALQPVANAIKNMVSIGREIGTVVLSAFKAFGVSASQVGEVLKEVAVFAATTATVFLSMAGVVGIFMAIAAAATFMWGAIGGPITLIALAIAALIAAYSMVQDKIVSFAGANARVSDFVAVAWTDTVKLIRLLWGDFMTWWAGVWAKIGPIVSAVLEFIKEYWAQLYIYLSQEWNKWVVPFLNGIAAVGKFIASIPDMVGRAVTSALSKIGTMAQTLLPMVGKVMTIMGDGGDGALLQQYGAQIGTNIKNNAGAVGARVAGDVKSQLDTAGAVASALISTTPLGLVGLAGHVAGRAQQAFSGFGSDAAKHMRDNPDQPHQTYDLSLLDAQDKELDPNSGADGKKPGKGKKGPDVTAELREQASAIRALAEEYDPLIGQEAKQDEGAAKVAAILAKLSKEHLTLAQAVKASGLTMEQWNQAAYEANAGINKSQMQDFLKNYTAGSSKDEAADAKRVETMQFMNRLLAERTSALAKGGEELKRYRQELADFGTTDEAVLAGIAQAKAGLTLDQANTLGDGVEALATKFLPGYDAPVKHDAQLDQMNELLKSGDPDKIKIAMDQLTKHNLTPATLATLTANENSGWGEKDQKDATSQLQALIKDHPWINGSATGATKLDNDTTQFADGLKGENAAQYQAIMAKLGVSQANFNQLLKDQAVAMGTDNNLFDAARAAADNYFSKMETEGQAATKIMTDGFKGVEDQIVSLAETGKVNFKSMIDSMLSDLIRFEVQQAEMSLFKGMTGGGGGGGIMSFFSSLFGGGGFTGMNMASDIIPAGSFSMAPALLGVGHSGGIAGMLSGSRMIDSSVFAGARRYHQGGLAGMPDVRSGETGIIAKKGEALLPTTRLPDGSYGIRAMTGAGAPTIGQQVMFAPNLQIHVQADGTVDGQAHGDAIAARITPALKEMVVSEIVNQTRAGGILGARSNN